MQIEYLDDIENPKLWVQGPVYVKERSTEKPVFATSDLWQVGYLNYRAILPIASVVRKWEVDGKVKRKIFMVYEDGAILRNVLTDLDANISGAKDLLRAYDESRIQVRELSRGK